MNRIVREHYPVEKLPEDLRDGLPAGVTVTVTVEDEGGRRDTIEPSLREVARNPKRMTFAEARALAQRAMPIGDDAVERIRKLRDEWDT
ncbi:hypothetical protein [Roseixanthobacter pseudopolyaromaticivorans]|uniref:hypothetical protein n=1 Tax=Xanthobacteraceae TaxID=335928 RepID=UPI003728DC1E